jgi:glycosyltransferase involved in cell wall biosynthesis
MHTGNLLLGLKKSSEILGMGKLVKIPLDEGIEAMKAYAAKETINKTYRTYIARIIREFIVYNPLLYHFYFQNMLKKRYPRPASFECRNAKEEANKVLQEYKVDLLVMHHIGGIDSAQVIEEARKRKIPFIFINHYSNDRLTNISTREQLNNSAGIAGVSAIGVPRRLKENYNVLSDGIDTEFFNPVNSLQKGTDVPIIIYPARIVRVKGQSDLIRACAKLRREGLRTKIVFAGRADSVVYEEELKGLAKRNGLTDDVSFIGQLKQEELRDLYNISSIMAFPTYHQEGLPRILMEAQAMKVPPIAYASGGTAGGIQHGKTGYLVRKGDIKTFTSRLRELLMNENKRTTLGEEGRKYVQKEFSLEALADRHRKYYLRILGETRGAWDNDK